MSFTLVFSEALDCAPFFAVGIDAIKDSFGGVNGLAVFFAFEECDDIVDVYDGVGFDAVFILHGLECRLAVLELFLAVNRDEETNDICVFDLGKRLHGFVDGRACGNHVFDDDDICLFGILLTDEGTAFTVVLYFFSVVREGEVLGVHVREFHGGSGAEGNAFVGWTVEVLCLVCKVFHEGCCIEFSKLGKRCSRTELSSVDKVRRFATALGHEVAEFESARFYEKVYKSVCFIHCKYLRLGSKKECYNFRDYVVIGYELDRNHCDQAQYAKY